ncbi:MAG TPA: methionyl-tRNA formyltransferase [Candidatus Acidoferrum sp.]|nr:methionyl-tRNA formyltransferase [Candidatus Acidoferrum sp.]
MRIVFCGTPQFAVPSLKHLLTEKEFEIVSVYTQPDRPRGRGQEISFSPVKEAAVAAGLDVRQPAKVRAPEVEEHLRSVAADAIVIIAYGQIIPARLLPIPRLGWINLHASLLPKYRGAAPIQWAIASGETVTGNTTMRIDAGMDTGEMLLQEELRIGVMETATELAGRLAEMGAALMAKTLRGLGAGELVGRAQEHGAATMAPMLKREDGRITWSRTATEIFNRMRGFAPWPGAYTEFRGQTCHLRGKPAAGVAVGEPGTILVEKDGVNVVCRGGSRLEITHVKQEGRKEISAGEFVRGTRVASGERFGRS